MPEAGTEILLSAAKRYADEFADEGAARAPVRRVAVVTCMDSRIDPAAVFGLAPGDANVLRNAGGVVTDDVIRSLAISQRLLGTREVLVVHHSDCGMLGLGDELLREIEAEVGIRPPWAVEGFTDLEADVRQSVARVRRSPFLVAVDAVRGFVYDVATGAVSEVDCPPSSSGSVAGRDRVAAP